jgi:hypothetical protein
MYTREKQPYTTKKRRNRKETKEERWVKRALRAISIAYAFLYVKWLIKIYFN